jgi:serine protease Do
VPLDVWRNKATQQVSVDVGQMPNQNVASAERNGSNPQAQNTGEKASALGMEFSSLTDQMRQRLRVQKGVKGAVISKVDPNTPAADLGLEPGDVVVAVNQQPVQSPAEAAQKLKEAQKSGDKQLLLLLNRHGTNEYLGLSIG